MAHELAHTIQQQFINFEGNPLLLSKNGRHEDAAEVAARNLEGAHSLGPLHTSQPGIARQPQRGSGKGEEDREVVDDLPEADTLAGEKVSSIVIDLRRKRVGFVVPAPKGMILGTISTDLQPGKYTVTPDVANKKWVFKGGSVNAGRRFNVSLEGANPWTLAYPEEIPVFVGFSTERRGGGPEGKTEEDVQADLVRIFDEEHRDIPEDPTIDGFIDYEYVPKWEVKGDVGAYAMLVTLKYLDSTREVIDLATVSDAQVSEDARKKALADTTVGTSGRLKPKLLNRSTTPNLWDLKQSILRLQKRLKEIGDEELLEFTLQHAFPAVFTVITITPFISPTSPFARSGGRRLPLPPGGRGGGGGRAPSARIGGPQKPSDTRVLVVGAETEAEFAYARGVTAKGQRVDVVNPRATDAAKEFAKEGGSFIQGKVENLPREPSYNLIREDFPYPTGKSITTIEGVGERLARLKSGGRWVVVTEEGAEFLPTLTEAAEHSGAKVTTYSVPKAHEGAPQSAYPKQPTRFVVIIEKP